MAISRWDSMYEAPTLREAMSRLFDESFVRPSSMLGRASAPPMDICLDRDNYVIEMVLHGGAPDTVNVTVLGNRVTIGGEYPPPAESREYLLREQPRGRFERTVTLPTEVDANQARGEHENGLLRLVLPKAESAKPHRISIDGWSSQRQGMGSAASQPMGTQSGMSIGQAGAQSGTSTEQIGAQPASSQAMGDHA